MKLFSLTDALIILPIDSNSVYCMQVGAPPDFTSDSWGLVYDLSINILLYKLS